MAGDETNDLMQMALENYNRIIDGSKYSGLYDWLKENNFSDEAAKNFLAANYVMVKDFYNWYDWAQFPQDMKTQKEFDKLNSTQSKISEDEQPVYNAVSARLMAYNSYLEPTGQTIWERYQEQRTEQDPPIVKLDGSSMQGVTLPVDNNGITSSESISGHLSDNFTENSTQPSTPQTKSFDWNNPNFQVVVQGKSSIRDGELHVDILPTISSLYGKLQNSWRDWQLQVENDHDQRTLETAAMHLKLQKIDPSHPEYDQRLQEEAASLKKIEDDVMGGISGGIKVVGAANKLLKIAQGSSKAKTVWDSIKATQPVYEGTQIPKSFEMAVGNQKYWVHPNATEHMFEYVIRRPTHSININSQEIMTSFQEAANKAVMQGIKYEERITIDNWEFIFSAPRGDGLLPVIKHAQYIP